MTSTAVNPFYRAPRTAVAPLSTSPQQRCQFARLPLAPITASPVPRLTSLYHFECAGEYGNRSYPGNCGGNLIRDLLLYFRPRNVYDPLCAAKHNGSCVA